jgi:UPF0755 protein
MTGTETEPQNASGEKLSSSEERLERRRKKRAAVVFFLIFILLWLAVHCFNRALTSKTASTAFGPRFEIVEIEPGASLSGIARKLRSEGVISNELLFTVAAAARRSTRDLKAGEYRFDTTASLLDVLSRLEQGRVLLHEFTIPEGYTVRQIARRLGKSGLADADELLRLSNDPEFCEELGIEGSALEGFLFPDTYKIAKGLSTTEVIMVMIERFWAVWAREAGERVDADSPSLREIVTIASIIEKEALFDEEKALIAGVIYNRLERGIPLQCDVTIRYPLDNYGTHLTYADLKMDSPYNSYRNTGIPPTAICSPGLISIRAALEPAETDYMYFVSMNNGRHKFSRTLEEHNRAVRKYQILNERG